MSNLSKLITSTGIFLSSYFPLKNINAQEILKPKLNIETNLSADIEGEGYGFEIKNSFEGRNFSHNLIANLHKIKNYNFSKINFSHKKLGFSYRRIWIGPQLSGRAESMKVYEKYKDFEDKKTGGFFPFFSTDFCVKYNLKNFSGNLEFNFIPYDSKKIGFFSDNELKTKIGNFELLAKNFNKYNYAKFSWTGKKIRKTHLHPYIKICGATNPKNKIDNTSSFEIGLSLKP